MLVVHYFNYLIAGDERGLNHFIPFNKVGF